MQREKLLFPIILFLMPIVLLAWGEKSYRVIGAIAETKLTEEAASQVRELLNGRELDDVASYMDELKEDPNFDATSDWLWMTVPNSPDYRPQEGPQAELVNAIKKLKTVLADTGRSEAHRAEALKLLVHLIADLHQPRESGIAAKRTQDELRGGWFMESSNLHRAWDSGILDSRNYSLGDLLNKLEQTMGARNVNRWTRGGVAEWAQEVTGHQRDLPTDNDNREAPEVDADQQWELLTVQLMKSGVRLAKVLNDSLG